MDLLKQNYNETLDFKVKPWITFDAKNRKLVHFNKMPIDSLVFTYYEALGSLVKKDYWIQFDFCRYLMPGQKPFYRIALDGKLITPARLIPNGCSIVREPISPEFVKGIIVLYVYYATDGQSGNLTDAILEFSQQEKVKIPVLENLEKNSSITELIKLFTKYSYNSIKITSPKIFSLHTD